MRGAELNQGGGLRGHGEASYDVALSPVYAYMPQCTDSMTAWLDRDNKLSCKKPPLNTKENSNEPSAFCNACRS